MSSLAHILSNQHPPPPPSPSSTTKTASTSALLPSPMENNLGKRERNTSSATNLPSHKRQSPSFHNNDDPLQRQELQQTTTPHTEEMTPPPSQDGSPIQYRHPRPRLAETEARQRRSPLSSHRPSSSYPAFPHTPQPSPRPPHQHQTYRPSQHLTQGPTTNNVPSPPKHRAEYAYVASTREDPRRLEPSALDHVQQQCMLQQQKHQNLSIAAAARYVPPVQTHDHPPTPLHVQQ